MNEQRPWRTITIFVSSTFTDMEAERDYLNNIIANKLEHYFERKRISLKFIDLRWGCIPIKMKQKNYGKPPY